MLRYIKAMSLLEVIGMTFFVESKVLLGLGIPLVSGWWWPIYGVSWESGQRLGALSDSGAVGIIRFIVPDSRFVPTGVEGTFQGSQVRWVRRDECPHRQESQVC